MTYKIIVKTNSNDLFTYTTDSYTLDDFFIRFIDKKGIELLIPKSKIEEVQKFG